LRLSYAGAGHEVLVRGVEVMARLLDAAGIGAPSR
jgi:hypothetical protein